MRSASVRWQHGFFHLPVRAFERRPDSLRPRHGHPPLAEKALLRRQRLTDLRTCRWPRAKPPAAVATKNPGRFWTGGAQMPSAFSKMAFPSFPAHGFLKTPSDILGRYAQRAKGQSSSRPLKQNEVFVCSFRHSLRSVGKLVFSHKLGSRLFQQKTAAPEKIRQFL